MLFRPPADECDFFLVLTCALLATVECVECTLASELAEPSYQAARSEEIYALQVLAFRPSAESPVPFFQAETSQRICNEGLHPGQCIQSRASSKGLRWPKSMLLPWVLNLPVKWRKW